MSSDQLDLVAMFKGLSLDQARDLAGRIRTKVGPNLEASRAPARVLRCVDGVYVDFVRELPYKHKHFKRSMKL